MYTIIVCMLLILMFWEVATWAVFFYVRRLIVKINAALERYIKRKKDIAIEICKYADNYNVEKIKHLMIEVSRRAERQMSDKMQRNIDNNFLLGEKTTILVSLLESENKKLTEDEDFFHLKNEFCELQQVIDGCVDYYNVCSDKLEKMITTYPSKAVAKFFRIKPSERLKK